jgi:hypothetical protein
MSYANLDGSYLSEAAGAPPKVLAPASGSTVTLGYGDIRLYIDNGAVLATLTLKLPAISYPGQSCEVIARSGVTALTVQSSTGGATVNPPTALTANVSVLFVALRQVNTSTPVWTRWR